MQANILLVEDEKNFGLVLRDYLRIHGFAVTLCEDGEQGLAAFKENAFDLCIVDIMMPKKDGFSLTAEIKALNAGVPLLFLSARGMREDMLKGYRLGADDYIVKPFDSELLLLKITAVLKRSALQTTQALSEFVFSEFRYQHPLRLLSHSSGRHDKLSPKEAGLLYELLCQRNKVVLKSTLLQKIWKSDTYFTGRSMDVYIVKLRKYLECDQQVSIENIHGSGYCLKCL